MAFRSSNGMRGELEALRRRVSDLAETVTSMAARQTGNPRQAARHTGKQLVWAGNQAGELARRHPAATGLTILAVAGMVACLAILASQNARGR